MLVPMLAVLALPGFVFLTGSVEGGGSGFKERGARPSTPLRVCATLVIAFAGKL